MVLLRPILAAVVALPTVAHANTPDDVFGVSSRTIAMGGAGTALPGDYGAVYYNPAALSGCTSDEVQLDVSYISNNLSFKDNNTAAAKPLVPQQAGDQTRITLGGCIALPFGLSLGIMAGFGTPDSVSIQETMASQTPDFVMYGGVHDQPVIAVGASWKVISTLSVGAGVGVLINPQEPLTANLPVLTPDPTDPTGFEPVSFSLGLTAHTYVAPRLGVLWAPLSQFRIGASYRGTLEAHLSAPASLDATVLGISLPLPLHIDALAWYSPRQYAVGASGEPIPNLSLTADFTYYSWSDLNTTQYPFITVHGDAGSLTGMLNFPHVVSPGWSDSYALRAGAELRLADLPLAIRAGLGYRASAVNNPNNSNVNLLDAPTATMAAGVGYNAGWTSGKGQWWRYNLPHVSFRADAFLRLDELFGETVQHTATAPNAVIPEKNYEFGGSMLQIGAMLTLGW
jgi:long-subunit fatty acid transport protein